MKRKIERFRNMSNAQAALNNETDIIELVRFLRTSHKVFKKLLSEREI